MMSVVMTMIIITTIMAQVKSSFSVDREEGADDIDDLFE